MDKPTHTPLRLTLLRNGLTIEATVLMKDELGD
jgi:hypothetical protein